MVYLLPKLKSRVQYVEFKKFVSDVIDILCGILQGSHLAPILFLTFINEVSLLYKDVEFLLFVNDLKLYKSISTIDDVYLFPSNLGAAYELWIGNDIILNPDKCKLSNTQNADSSTLNSTRQVQVGIPLMQWKQDSLDEAFPMGNKETNESWHEIGRASCRERV